MTAIVLFRLVPILGRSRLGRLVAGDSGLVNGAYVAPILRTESWHGTGRHVKWTGGERQRVAIFSRECSTLSFVLDLGRWARGSGARTGTLGPGSFWGGFWSPDLQLLFICILEFVFDLIASALSTKTGWTSVRNHWLREPLTD